MDQPEERARTHHIVAVTCCPTGVAHTYMSAEALAKVAILKGHTIDVEKQGSAGVRDALTEESIARANVVIIAADTAVDLSRFAGKPIHETSTGVAIRNTEAVIEEALNLVNTSPPPVAETGAGKTPKSAAPHAGSIAEPYKHLLTGLSFAVPLVVAGGLLIALSLAIGSDAPEPFRTLASSLMDVGGGAAFRLFVPVLAGYMAFSIADRPGLAPGMVGGLIAYDYGGGFVGGIVAGFLAGYAVRALDRAVRLPRRLDALKPMLILPLVSTAFVGLTMIHVVAKPAAALLHVLLAGLANLGGVDSAVLGAILGAMVAFDMGGPVNKAAYAFGVGLLSVRAYEPMAAVMAAGMSAPLGLALAAKLLPQRFTAYERHAATTTAVLGLAFITEGAIPFAARDPMRVVPAAVIGSAVAGALSLGFGCTLYAPLGGVFVLLVPHAVGNFIPYVLAITAGTAVTAAALLALKRWRKGDGAEK